jgi:hypothetical protein
VVEVRTSTPTAGGIVAAAVVAIIVSVLLTTLGIMLGAGVLAANGIIGGTLSFWESLGLALCLGLVRRPQRGKVDS